MGQSFSLSKANKQYSILLMSKVVSKAVSTSYYYF